MSTKPLSATPLEIMPVRGVRLAAIAAGIRYAERLDLVALVFDPGTRAAGVFTRNAFCAAPVLLAKEHLRQCEGRPRLLLINTGNANAGTGQAGFDDALSCCQAAAAAAALSTREVLPFSTGVIGEDLPVDRLSSAIPALLEGLDEAHWARAAQGILTTDTRAKGASRQFSCAGIDYCLSGIAKGAGMLRPNMATMLAFLATDAPVSNPVLDTLLHRAVERSFHRITVDGDTSTNDAVLLAATGAAGGSEALDVATPLARALGEALDSLCVELAQALVRDAEGASKFVAIEVIGGASVEECLEVAFTVAHSPLVKTALFASDPNWGRILAAIGRADLEDLDVNRVRVDISGVPIAEGGARSVHYSEADVAAVMALDDLQLQIDLGRGAHRETVWTSDLSYDYVRINAEYRS
ncbi:MAG: glutamate N-acetyltransferase/amino-acid N-acetyltransferase [Halieaceae bacterium]